MDAEAILRVSVKQDRSVYDRATRQGYSKMTVHKLIAILQYKYTLPYT